MTTLYLSLLISVISFYKVTLRNNILIPPFLIPNISGLFSLILGFNKVGNVNQKIKGVVKLTKVIVLKPELNHINWLEEKKLKYAVNYLKSLKGDNDLNIRVFDQYGQEYSYPDVGYFEHVVNDDNEVLDIKCVNGGYEITIKIIVRDYYEVLYYTGETEKEAFNNDFLSEQFDTEKEAKKRVEELEVKDNVFGIFSTVRNFEDEIIGDF